MSRATKFDKVVRREICSIQSKGTKRASFIDGDAHVQHSFLMAVAEKVRTGNLLTSDSHGVALVFRREVVLVKEAATESASSTFQSERFTYVF